MSHSHRTMEERIRIEVFVSEGLSCRNIARRLGRHHTTLVCASRGKAALLTCHERTSRFLLLAKVEDKTAASFNAALLARLCELPRALPQSLTLDNGPAMAGCRELESIAGLRTYFLQTTCTVAAWHKRKRGRAFAAVFSQGHRLAQDHG